MPKKPKFDQKREVRKLARERNGPVPASRPIEPKSSRKKPKHPKSLIQSPEEYITAQLGCGKSPKTASERARLSIVSTSFQRLTKTRP